MKANIKKKAIALATSLAMAFTMIPQLGMTAHATAGDPAMVIGTGVLQSTSNTKDAQTVYMADKTWRVIGYGGTGVASSADTMTLLSAGILKKDVVFREYIRDEGSDSWYHQSILQSEVEAIANTFSAGERAGIAARTLLAGDYNGYDTDTVSRYRVYNALLWPLSTKEAHYTLNGDIRNVNDFWWLRSPGHTAPPFFTCHISYVKSDGNVDEEGCLVTEKNGVRPAFNYKLNSVIFTSAATGGKSSGTVGPDALNTVGTNGGSEWKLTVKSGHNNFTVGDVTTCDGKTLNIKYSGAITGNTEYISAIIKDKDGNIKYYGNLKKCAADTDASGTAKVKVDGKLGTDDTLYVFNEQLNGDKKTDSSSELKEVAIPEQGAHVITHHDAVTPTCTEDGTVEYWSCENCNKNFGDAQGTTELTTIIDPKTGHNMTHHAAALPTCTEDGTVEYWSCNKCKKNFGDEQGTTELETIVDPKTGHNMTHHNAVPPTCTEDGTVEYWSCDKCKKNFGDEQGTTELTTIVDPKTGHKYGEWKSLDDKQHQGVCEHDKSHVITEDHTWDAGKVTKAATEKAEGVRIYTCTACKETKTEKIPKLKPSAPKVRGTLLARMTAQKKSFTIRWNKIQGAAGYDIFFARCDSKNKKYAVKKVKTIKGNKTFKWKKSGLKRRASYKAYVKAYVMKNGKKSYVRTSPVIHAYTSNGTKKYTNAKSVKVNKTRVTLKKGKTFKIKAKVKKVKKSRKLMPKSHVAKLRYLTSYSKIATVSRSGKITAKSKGTCYIYVFAHNGVSKRIKVTVK